MFMVLPKSENNPESSFFRKPIKNSYLLYELRGKKDYFEKIMNYKSHGQEEKIWIIS